MKSPPIYSVLPCRTIVQTELFRSGRHGANRHGSGEINGSEVHLRLAVNSDEVTADIQRLALPNDCPNGVVPIWTAWGQPTWQWRDQRQRSSSAAGREQ